MSEENCWSKCKLNRRRKKFQSGKLKAGRMNSSKTAMSSKTTASSKTIKILVDPESWVLWRTFSIWKWRVNVFKANEFSIGKWVNVFKATSFREDFISEKIGYSVERFRTGNEERMYSKPTTPLKNLKMTTGFREDFISEKTSFQKRLGTLENVFDPEMKSEWKKIQVDPERRLHFREDFISEKIGYSGERFRSGNEGWMKVNVAINPFRAMFFLWGRNSFMEIEEDCVLWRMFSFGKWRVNAFKHTTWLAF